MAGIDIRMFKGHSARAVSITEADVTGVSLFMK